MDTDLFSGCTDGIGKGNFLNGAGGGAGHGGRGGSGYFNGREISGGNEYGNASLPCELGSGTKAPNESYGHVIGGGMIGKCLNTFVFICLKGQVGVLCFHGGEDSFIVYK